MIYYKVIAIFVDVFESAILGEEHFGTKQEAEAWAKLVQDENVITVIAEM